MKTQTLVSQKERTTCISKMKQSAARKPTILCPLSTAEGSGGQVITLLDGEERDGPCEWLLNADKFAGQPEELFSG